MNLFNKLSTFYSNYWNSLTMNQQTLLMIMIMTFIALTIMILFICNKSRRYIFGMIKFIILSIVAVLYTIIFGIYTAVGYILRLLKSIFNIIYKGV